MFLIRSSMQRHRCDHIPHSSSEDFEDITITHTPVFLFARTSPVRSQQMGPVSGFLWTPLSLHTTHPCSQKCSLPSADRGCISIHSNPCIFGGQNSQILFKYPGLKQESWFRSEQPLRWKDVTPSPNFLCWLPVEDKVIFKILAYIFKSTYMTSLNHVQDFFVLCDHDTVHQLLSRCEQSVPLSAETC